MKCKALILGAVERSGTKEGKPWTMKTVNFVDTESPAGSACEMSLGKDDELKPFQDNRMKIVEINVFQNGKYTNFGGFVSKAA